MGTGYSFDLNSVQRIVNTVKGWENQPPDPAPLPTAKLNLTPFYALLGAERPDHPGQYRWIMYTRSQGVFTAASPVIQDNTNYSAREINNQTGLTGIYALLFFDGYDPTNSNSPLYRFSFGASPPPGSARQVLMLDDNLNAVWDWVQTP